MSPLSREDITTVNNSLIQPSALSSHSIRIKVHSYKNKTKNAYISRDSGAIFLIQATTPKFDPEGLHSLLYDLKIYFAYTEPKF